MKKINIILDLDQTLISSEVPSKVNRMGKKVMKFDSHMLESEYVVFGRPHLQEFLEYLFEHFNVSVWTAASKSYALFIIDKFILTNPSRKLDFIFFSYHCQLSKKVKNELKSVSILWDVFGLAGYNTSNTLIIDDNDEVFRNQKCNCFHIKPFSVLGKDSEYDNELVYLVEKLKVVNSSQLPKKCLTDFMK